MEKRGKEKRFTLRMDAEVFEEIAELARKHRRSIAKEVEEAIAIYIKQQHNK